MPEADSGGGRVLAGGIPALVPRLFDAGPGLHPGHPTAAEGCRSASRGLLLKLMTLAISLAQRFICSQPHLKL